MNREATILLVEDNEMDIELTLDAFQTSRLANPVQVVQTGDAALHYVHGQGEFADRHRYPLPDLILLDLKMPGLDGMDVLRELKSHPKFRRIPVVVLTSSSDEGDRALTYDLGVNSYLVKPVSFEGFIEVVRSIQEYWLTLNVAASTEWGQDG